MSKKALLALAAGMALLLAGCGGGDDSGSSDGAAVTNGGEGTIAVSIGETDESTMYMNLSQTTAAAGEVTFVITNEGQKEHEFVVLASETPAAEFPIVEGDEIDEDASGVEVVDEIEEVAAGATEELTVTLEPGHYALICNLEGHYRMGMRADFDVS